MTHATSLTVLLAAAQVSPAVSLGSGITRRAAIDDLPGDVAALWLGLRGKADVGGQRFSGPVGFDPEMYLTLYGGRPFLGVDRADYYQYDRTYDLHQWAIGGNEKFRIDREGASVFGAATFYDIIQADADNATNIGRADRRWATIFAATGSINTSDERDKTWRGALSAAELSAAGEIAGSIGIYQWNDAIAEKGADGARWHTGVKAQQVVAIMTAHGLTPTRYGFVCHDSWLDQPAVPAVAVDPVNRVPASPGRAAMPAGDRYGIRPDELHAFLIAAQEQRIRVLEGA